MKKRVNRKQRFYKKETFKDILAKRREINYWKEFKCPIHLKNLKTKQDNGIGMAF